MSKDISTEIKAFQIFGLQLYHHQSSIKIGTDAVLLSAAIRRFCTAERILDVGCGCGIIGLAYLKKHLQTFLTGLDIHMPSIYQSAENARINNLTGRTKFLCLDFLAFDTDLSIDLIVSNPPFFQNQLHSPQSARNNARHGDKNLPIHRLIGKAGVIRPKELVLILPAQDKSMVVALAEFNRFYVFREILVFSKPNSGQPIRIILFFSGQKSGKTVEKLSLVIRNEDNSQSTQYLNFVYDS
ncbi:MAG: tRNA1(Val) (adenine(37)-N6)-methyltransferase [Thermaurantimonas sp.]